MFDDTNYTTLAPFADGGVPLFMLLCQMWDMTRRRGETSNGSIIADRLIHTLILLRSWLCGSQIAFGRAEGYVANAAVALR